MPSIVIPPDAGCPLVRGSLRGDSAREMAQWVWSAPMGWDGGHASSSFCQKRSGRQRSSVPSETEQTLPGIGSTLMLAHAGSQSGTPIHRTRDPPTAQGQIHCFEAPPQKASHSSALIIAPTPMAWHSHAQALVPPWQPPPAPQPPRPPPAINRCRHLHSSQSGGYGSGKQHPGVQLISMEMYAAHKQTGARLIRAAPLIHRQPPAYTSPRLFLGSFTKQMYLIKKETPEQPESDESCTAVSKGAALSPGDVATGFAGPW